MANILTPDQAGAFAHIAMGHVTREYPHKADHVMDSDADAYIPRQVHPIFHGSYDWHSCVHGYWLLARVRRLFPDIAESRAIDDLFASMLTPEKVAAERAYLTRSWARTFERPYGWGWLLMLASELTRGDNPHAATLAPLAQDFRNLFMAYLPALTYPLRVGNHANTAFALILAQIYGQTHDDQPLLDLLEQRALHWYGTDKVVQTWEPGGEDFLSPVLTEACAMAHILPRETFQPWLAHFLSELPQRAPAELFVPAHVSDESDGRIAHLNGLNLSRAWTMREIAGQYEDEATRRVLLESAQSHIDASIGAVSGDYMGEHWLASFALLAMTAGTQ
ncbi:DUF2891 domain-containing protein [Sphingobium rhizovicinum]|uniref:DUF2891 domain-containing protein n=1 Tax=Sphingobium rhizovicinum TaxID=432308 RepID=A0ABV7NK89_9SPHN